MPMLSHLALWAAFSFLLAQSALAGSVNLMSRAATMSATADARYTSQDRWPARVSADGRYAVFVSSAVNLVPGQTEGNLGAAGLFAEHDVFLYDRTTGSRTLVSRSRRASGQRTGNAGSAEAVISADGRYVAFTSAASDLVTGQIDPSRGNRFDRSDFDVFLYDRVSRSMTLVSHSTTSPVRAARGSSSQPSISADGRFVVFGSEAPDLVPNVSNPLGGSFLYDRVSGKTTLINHRYGSPTASTTGGAGGGTISADGNWILFSSTATDLVPGQNDANQQVDVFLQERATGVTTLVSHGPAGATVTASGQSVGSTISADGRFVTFTSDAAQLVAGQEDQPFSVDAFLFDRSTGAVTLVSHAAGSPGTAIGADFYCKGSADGRFVTFVSGGAAVAGQLPGFSENLFLWDRQSDTSVLVNHVPGSAVTGSHGLFLSLYEVSADGGIVAFDSDAGDLVPGQSDAAQTDDIFLYRRASGQVSLVSHRAGAPAQAGDNESFSYPALSADGSTVVFTSSASDLVAGLHDFNRLPDVFLHRVAGGASVAVTLRDPATPAVSAADDSTITPAPATIVSADGRYAVFASEAPNLVPGQVDGNGGSDVFLFDRVSQARTLVSRSPGQASRTANAPAESPAISADGRYVAFVSAATDLVAGQVTPPFSTNVFLFDRSSGQVRLVSHAASDPRTGGSGESFQPSISADGRYVVFLSKAGDLVPGPGSGGFIFGEDVYLFDRESGAVALVSRSQSATGRAGNCMVAAISGDGAYVAFVSGGEGLVPGQEPDAGFQLYLHDRTAGTNRLVSGAQGSATEASNGRVSALSLSADGRFVAYLTNASDAGLSVVDADGSAEDVFLFDRATGSTTLISHAAGSATTTGNGGCLTAPAVSADGRFVAFLSWSTNLIAGQVDRSDTFDTFLWDRTTGRTVLASHVDGRPSTAGSSSVSNLPQTPPAISADGRYVAFLSNSPNLAAGQNDRGAIADVFLFDRLTGRIELASRTDASARVGANGDSAGPAISADGASIVFISQGSDLVAGDLNFRADAFLFRRTTQPGAFFALPSCRLLDTRTGAQGPVRSGVAESWPVYTACGIPSTARALSVHVTVVAPTGAGFLTLFAGDEPLPATHTLDFGAKELLSRDAVVPLAEDGSGNLGVFAALASKGSVHVVLDVDGYFE